MAITLPKKSGLGVLNQVKSFPKVQYDKIVEIVNAINDFATSLTTATITATTGVITTLTSTTSTITSILTTTITESTSLAGITFGSVAFFKHTGTAANATATLTAAQVKTGYITSTSAAPTTLTLPTGTLLGAAIGASQGTIHDLFIDNTAGANTVTIAVAVNGILSAAAAANGASQGLLTVPSGVTGQACFRLMFSSATAYTFTRVA